MLRLLSLALLLSFCCVWLAWGGGNSGFLAALEWEICSSNKLGKALSHPFVLFPLAGQILLLAGCIFPRKKLILSGAILCALLVFMVVLSGLLAGNMVSAASGIPFFVFFVLLLRRRRKMQ